MSDYRVTFYLTTILIGLVFVMVVIGWSDAAGRTPFIAMMETHFQVTPGATRVWADCGCTVRYLGTSVHGKVYSVQIEKMD